MKLNLTRATARGSSTGFHCDSRMCFTTEEPEAPAASRQTAGEVVDDGVVTAKVKAKLVDDPVTKAYQINVETFKGTVQLSGFVDSAEARSRAAQLAGAVGGVKDVENSLEVRKP